MRLWPVTGVVKGAVLRVRAPVTAALLLAAGAALWLSLSGGTEGLVAWLVLGAALYLPYLAWLWNAMLRTPPRIGLEGVQFMHMDPPFLLGREVRFAWEEVVNVSAVDARTERGRGLVFTLRNGTRAKLVTSFLENEREVVQAVLDAWDMRKTASRTPLTLN